MAEVNTAFEEWWKNQNGDPYEIGEMQLARIAFNAGVDNERKRCSNICRKIEMYESAIRQAVESGDVRFVWGVLEQDNKQ